MQTILGSGGTIGAPLAKELKKYTDQIRLVSRNPKKINETDLLFPCDVNDTSQIDKAIEGSEIVYVVIGFEYKLKVWEEQWPKFIQTVIQSCKKHHSKLVFFDNVYVYDRNEIAHMTENSKLNPPSKKGIIRKQIVEMILDEIKNGSLTALIARSADFYGPGNDKSMFIELIVKNMLKGKSAQYFGDVNKIHTYTFTPDAAHATALLGNTPDAFNQTWHLPTTQEKIQTNSWIELVAKELNRKPKSQKLPLWMVKVLGIFIPIMKEFPEMNYQYEGDYFFDCSKFEKRFGIVATTPQEGVKQTIASYKK